ncbi:MAG: TIGR02147 family protein [Bacteriovoracia bacterium]
MQKSWTTEQIEKFLEARDPRAFLKFIMDEKERDGRKLSFANLARMAGFASRSYPRDVLLGKKHLTAESASSFARALKLNADLAQYFILLVEKDNLLRTKAGVGQEKAEKQLQTIARRIRRKLVASSINGNEVYSIADSSIVYASLGAPEKGATLEEVAQKCHLKLDKVRLVITKLVEIGLAREDRNRFFALSNHVAFESMKQNGDFQKIYVERLKAAIRKAETQFESNQNLFLESTFSISKESMPQFKAELRELLGRFVEEREVPEGTSVASLACAFFAPTGN